MRSVAAWWVDKASELGSKECGKCRGFSTGRYLINARGQRQLSYNCYLCGEEEILLVQDTMMERARVPARVPWEPGGEGK